MEFIKRLFYVLNINILSAIGDLLNVWANFNEIAEIVTLIFNVFNNLKRLNFIADLIYYYCSRIDSGREGFSCLIKWSCLKLGGCGFDSE